MIKKIFLHLLLLIPALLHALFLFVAIFLENNIQHDYYDAGWGEVYKAGMILLMMFVIVCFITVIGLILFVKYKPFNAWLLLISFILSPVPMYIYEYNSSLIQFSNTGMVAIFYAIPFCVISVIIAIIVQKKRKKSEEVT